tara:strand:+ start:591 stop:1124 length:534 start_codon:yes stop_codon:yes gene_type:complete
MKAFDQVDGKAIPDKEFNEQAKKIDDKLVSQKSNLEKEQEETNKGLKIEMRNQTMCPILRVEFPSEITEEIKDGNDIEALNAIITKISKTYLKKAYNLEKKLTIGEKGQIKILMFLDDTGQADLTWGSSTNFGYGHDLYPKIYDSITAEKGVMLVMPDYVSTGLVTLRNYKLWRVSF